MTAPVRRGFKSWSYRFGAETGKALIFCPDPTLSSSTGPGSPLPAVDLLCLLDLTEELQFQVNAGGTGHREALEEGFPGQQTLVPGGSKETRVFASLYNRGPAVASA